MGERGSGSDYSAHHKKAAIELRLGSLSMSPASVLVRGVGAHGQRGHAYTNSARNK